MNKYQLKRRTEAVFNETKTALQMVYDELNQGQQKKLLKDEKVAALLAHYEIIEE